MTTVYNLHRSSKVTALGRVSVRSSHIPYVKSQKSRFYACVYSKPMLANSNINALDCTVQVFVLSPLVITSQSSVRTLKSDTSPTQVTALFRYHINMMTVMLSDRFNKIYAIFDHFDEKTA